MISKLKFVHIHHFMINHFLNPASPGASLHLNEAVKILMYKNEAQQCVGVVSMTTGCYFRAVQFPLGMNSSALQVTEVTKTA